MPKQIKTNLPNMVRNVSCGVLHDFGWGFWIALDRELKFRTPPWFRPNCAHTLERGFFPFTLMDEDDL